MVNQKHYTEKVSHYNENQYPWCK